MNKEPIPLCCPVCGYLNISDLGDNRRKCNDCLDEWIEDRLRSEDHVDKSTELYRHIRTGKLCQKLDDAVIVGTEMGVVVYRPVDIDIIQVRTAENFYEFFEEVE